MTENKDKNIPIVINFLDIPENVVGEFIIPYNGNRIAKDVYAMMKMGYTFELAPSLIVKETSENGTIIDAELIGLSILTNKASNEYIMNQTKDIDPAMRQIVEDNFDKLIWKD